MHTAEEHYFQIHEDYFEVIFKDEMTAEDVEAVHAAAESTSIEFKKADKPLLVLVDISKRTQHDQSLLREKVKLLDTDGLHAVAFYGPGGGLIHTLVNSVISSYSSVLPMKHFSEKEEALDWLRATR